MTTYTFSATANGYSYDPVTGSNFQKAFVRNVDIVVTARDNSGFSYTYDNTQSVRITPDFSDAYSITIDGYDASLDFFFYLSVLEWGQATAPNFTGLLVASTYQVAPDTLTIFSLGFGGDPFPRFSLKYDFLDFLNDQALTEYFAAGFLAPGTTILWQDLSYSHVTETDVIVGTAFDDDIRSGRGDDQITSSAGMDIYQGGAGDHDALSFASDPNAVLVNLTTGAGTDGWQNRETISGIEDISGSAFGDTLIGNHTANAISGESGADEIKGLDGNDHLLGGDGNDVVKGGAGNDRIEGNAGDDVLSGGDGADDMAGGSGDDVMEGGSARDVLSGGIGADTLRGGKHGDTINGGAGNDLLMGDAGSDVVDGGKGNDALNGGKGNDTLSGGTGDDTFVFQKGFGRDKIADFDATSNGEKIDLSGVQAIKSWNDLKNNHLKESGDDVKIDDLNGNTIRLLDVDIADLGGQDFIF
ncbi:MAG: calcium-binding protein [Marinibacterium sp.]